MNIIYLGNGQSMIAAMVGMSDWDKNAENFNMICQEPGLEPIGNAKPRLNVESW